jgi:hypothetical protein
MEYLLGVGGYLVLVAIVGYIFLWRERRTAH